LYRRIWKTTNRVPVSVPQEGLTPRTDWSEGSWPDRRELARRSDNIGDAGVVRDGSEGPGVQGAREVSVDATVVIQRRSHRASFGPGSGRGHAPDKAVRKLVGRRDDHLPRETRAARPDLRVTGLRIDRIPGIRLIPRKSN